METPWPGLEFSFPVKTTRNVRVLFLLFVLIGIGAVFMLRPDVRPAKQAPPLEVAPEKPVNMAVLPAPEKIKVPLIETRRSLPTPLTKTAATNTAPLIQFLNWANAYTSAPQEQRLVMISEGVELAAARRPILAALIQTDPEEALRDAVPMHVRQQLPPEIIAQLEERVSGRGEFAVLGSPQPAGETNVPPIQRFARLNGQTYQAYVYGRRANETSRADIPMHGIAIDNQMAVHENPVRPIEPGEIIDSSLAIQNPDEVCTVSGLPSRRAAAAQVGDKVVYLCCGAHIDAYNQHLTEEEQSAQAQAVATPWTTGVKSLLFMLAVFPDDSQPAMTGLEATNTLNSVSNWLAEMSYNITTIRFTVTPPLMMPHTRTWYATNLFTFMDDARAKAKTQGYDTANYDRDCLMFKPIYSDWIALGYVGGKGMWLQSSNRVEIITHELGHNYGLWHANAWNASGDTIIGPGTHEEPGNPFDMMTLVANSDQYHYNACAKNSLGWLPDANVTTITNSGQYRIYAYDTEGFNGANAYALKINKDTRDYWVELRSQFPTNKWLQNGVLISWSPWAQSDGGTHLLDMTPGSPFDKEDAALVVGRTFTDPFAGIHITPIQKNNGTAPPSMDVVVNVGMFPNNHSPTLAINASSTAVAANTVVTFTASGNDSDGDSLVYYWDFDDPSGALSFSNGVAVAKSWSTSGDYRVRCVVSDMKGGTASAAVLVTVGSPTLYRISGRVLNGAAPLDNVRVSAGAKNGFTDANGNYVITRVAAGSYTLQAVKPGWSFSPSGNSISISGSVSNVNFAATPVTYSVSGRVTDNSSGIGGVTISAGTNSFVTASDGNFTLAVPAGAYTLNATKLNYELTPAASWTNPVVLDWVDASGDDFIRPRYPISGVVSNLPSAPVVTVGDANEQSSVTSSGANQWSYTLQLPRGNWNVTAAKSGYTILPANFANPIAVSESASGSFNFNAVAGTTYAIRGNVAESDRPVSGALISAGGHSGYSDTFGNFVLPGLPNGSYTVTASSPDYTFSPATHNALVSNADVSGQDFLAQLLFWLMQPAATTNGFNFQLSGGSNRTFRIECSSNFTVWQPLATVTNATGQLNLNDPAPTNAMRVYRAVLVP